MAFLSSPCRSGRTLRNSHSRKSKSSRVFHASVALLIVSVAASLWVALSSGAAPGPGGDAALIMAEARPGMRLLKRPVPPPTDPRRLVVGEQQVADLEPTRIAQAWNRSRVAAALAAAENESATEFALLLPEGVEKTARVVNFGVAGDPRHVGVLRRALAAAGTDRSERVAFIAPAAHGIKIAATAGGPVPMPEASIEIAFVAPLAPRTTDVAALEADADVAQPGPTRAAALAGEGGPAPQGSDPFGQVLANAGPLPSTLPDDGPLPSAKPRNPAQTAVEAPLPMKAKSEPRRAPGNLLAYARPQNPLKDEEDSDGGSSWFGNKGTLPGRGSKIAVYDISAGVVHMPNGEKLDASSGRGAYRDNPKFVHVRMRGSTPPNVYHLRMREALFHGVEAIRMTPVNQKMMFGRDGMLTHSYLLRRRGDSSGCVVFEDYPRFLNAFKRGEVKTLIVVPRISELPKFMAML